MTTLPSYAVNQPTLPEMYERWLVGPLFRPFARLILDEVQLTAGDRLLDIACGTGIVARVARERLGSGGSIVGVDVSPDMLSVAKAVAPGIDWREGSALDLPLRDSERFDVVVCQQGMQFFPDKARAATQMHRAVLPEGRLAVATWRPDDEMPVFHELRAVAERHLGPVMDKRHSYGDAELLAALLETAGFRDVQVKTVSRTVRFEDGAQFLRMNTMALVGMSDAARTVEPERRNQMVASIVEQSMPVLDAHKDDAAIAIETRTNLATANT